MPSGDRDRVVDRLLRTSAGDLLAVPGPDCLDAEMLAAWHEGGLDQTTARRVERHLATCARCQMMAAAFSRAAVAAPVPVRPVWGLRWFVPVGVAVAAAAAIWVFVPRQSSGPVPDQNLAMNEPAAPTAGPANAERPRVVAPGANAEGGAGPVVSQARPVPEASEAAAPLATPPTDGRENRAAKAEPAALPALRDALVAQAPARPAPPPTAPAAAAAPPAVAPQMTPQRESVQVTADAPLIQAQSAERSIAVSTSQVENLPINRGNATNVAEAAAGAGRGEGTGRMNRLGGAGQDNIQMDGVSAMDSGVVVDFAAPTAPPGVAGAEPPASPGTVRTAGSEVRTASPPTRWRVLADGRVQRSLTGGASWDAIAVDASARVNAGAAPSPMVCWLVGPRGVVLRTNDRLHFQRLTFPETVDLSAIRATSDLAATVTAADGRVFETSDGGTTWRVGER